MLILVCIYWTFYRFKFEYKNTMKLRVKRYLSKYKINKWQDIIYDIDKNVNKWKMLKPHRWRNG